MTNEKQQTIVTQAHLTRAGVKEGTKALADPTHATTATAEQNFIFECKGLCEAYRNRGFGIQQHRLRQRSLNWVNEGVYSPWKGSTNRTHGLYA